MLYGLKSKTLSIIFWLALAVSTGCAEQPDSQHMLFQITGSENTVYLLGSIHMLRKQDHPLPVVMKDAYDESEVLVMELDMDDLDPLALASLFGQAAQAQDGETLTSLMGDSYQEATDLAVSLDANLTVFDKFEPWFVALTIVNLELMKIGFYEHLGIESHFTKLAAKDQKEILGLETAEFQLSLFDQLSVLEQRSMLILSLQQATELESEMADMVAAWQAGDSQALHQMLLEPMRDMGDLYDDLVIKRNKNWISHIEQYLTQSDDYLVIVGAGHLSGENGVVQLLRRGGYQIEQL